MKEPKRKYDRPSMERVLVELEDGFCAASVADHTKTRGVKTIGHELNVIEAEDFEWNKQDGDRVGDNGWK